MYYKLFNNLLILAISIILVWYILEIQFGIAGCLFVYLLLFYMSS